MLAYDDREFLKTRRPDLRQEAEPMVYIDQERAVDEYMEAFEDLYSKYDSAKTRIFFGPNWVQGVYG